MKMKRRQRSMGALVAGTAGFGFVLLITLALNLFGFQGQGQAEDDPAPILPTLDIPPTPTIPPSPTPLSSLASTVLANPQFQSEDALSTLEIVDIGTLLPEDRSVWTVRDGALLQNRTAAAGNPNPYETMAFFGSPEWTDYTLSARIYDQGNGSAGLVVRRQGDSFYRMRLIGNAYSDTPKYLLEKVIDGEATELATFDAPGYEYHTWYELTLSVRGAKIQGFVDGKLVLEAEDQTLTSGQPGLYTRAMGALRFGDVLVTE